MKTCLQYKTNRRAADFCCNKGEGHTDSHRDPVTAAAWKHPEHPYGMRGPAKQVTAHAKTKHGCYYSAAPASK